MDTSISGILKTRCSRLEPHSNTADDVIFALMTPILPRKMNTMSMPSKEISAGFVGYDWGDHLYTEPPLFLIKWKPADNSKKAAPTCVIYLKTNLNPIGHVPTESGREPRKSPIHPENIALFDQMKKGDLAEGTCALGLT